MKQSQIFLDGESAAWLERNQGKLGHKDDPVLLTMEKYQLKPKRVLEIGCANGWRLDILQRAWGCDVSGIDPQLDTSFGGYIFQGTADDLDIIRTSFDAVIYGWCLYLTDPEDYFMIVTEGDRVLKDGGFLIIYDFFTDYPYKNKYKHKDGLFTHKMDFSKLWLGHPAYSLYGRDVFGEDDNQTAVTILKKNMKTAFLVNA